MNLPMDCGMSKRTNRFRDPNTSFLTSPAIVICPRCNGAARASNGSVACNQCGFARSRGQPNFVAETNIAAHMAWRPRCVRCGTDLPSIARRGALNSAKQLPVRCDSCGHVASYPVRIRPQPRDANLDPASGLPYFLTVPVGRNILWVRNLDHLAMMENYVSAQLRERSLNRTHMTILERLPKWVKIASNRNALLRGLERLRKASKTLE